MTWSRALALAAAAALSGVLLALALLPPALNRPMPTPHRCPVCEGRQTVPASFYSPGPAGVYLSGEVEYPEPCRSCAGTGVLWSPPSADGQSDGAASWRPLPPSSGGVVTVGPHGIDGAWEDVSSACTVFCDPSVPPTYTVQLP